MLTDAQRLSFERAAARSLGAAWRGRVRRLMDALSDPPSVDDIPASFWRGLDTDTRAVLEKKLVDVFLAGYRASFASAESLASSLGLAELGGRVRWGAVNQRAAKWAAEHAGALIGQIEATTRERVASSVARWLVTPDQGLEALQKRLAPLFGPQRAGLIAVTEVTSATSAAEAQLQADLRRWLPESAVPVLVWATSNDERVCPVCAPRNQRPQGGGWAEPPPAHPRCRCSVGLEIRVRR